MLSLTDEQRAIQETARAFAAEEMAPHAARWDAEHILPRDVLKKAAALGFASIYISEEHGGCGLGRLEAALVFEELSRACPSTTAMLTIHTMASWMIDRFGSAAQRARFLPGLASFERMASYCLTEPGAGSDAAALSTRARAEGGHYVLDGQKAFISGAGESDLYVVMARTGGEGAKGISCFVVEKGTSGLSFGAQEKKLGWHSQPTAAVLLENARVPAENRIGAEGDGFKIAMAGLDGGRINIGACSLGGAAAALDAAIAYVKERKQFGQPIADFQATQFRLADMATELQAARLMIHRAAEKVTAGDADAGLASAMAKRFATDTGFRVVNEALQLFGGYGYLMDFPVERLLRDLRVHQILEGTNEIMRVIIARKLLG